MYFNTFLQRSVHETYCLHFIMTDNKQKITQLSLKQKVEILDCLKLGEKVTDIATRFKCDRSTISKTKQNEVKLREEYLRNKNSKKVRNRKGNFIDVDEAVLQWFTQMRAKNAVLSGWC